jgi:alkylhydroperoxidase family enzyme
MRPEKPRLEPLPLEEIDPDIRERFGDGPMLNIFRTLAHHPKLLKRWLVFGNHVLAKSSLPARERELVILRVGWRCRAEYEWSQHVDIALRSGVTEQDVRRVTEGPEAAGFSDAERALLRATDELLDDACVSDATWSALAAHFDKTRIMDLIFTVGQYNLVSMALNSLGVPLEQGARGFPPR